MHITLMTTVFIGANVDFFIVLIFMLQKYRLRYTMLGYTLGVLTLFTISAVAGQMIQTFLPTWSIGLLGLLPIWFAIRGETDDDDQTKSTNSANATWFVYVMYLASCGADNFALYIPVLSTFNLFETIFAGIYFIIWALLTSICAYYICHIRFVKTLFTKYGDLITRIFYLAIGLFVMFDTGLLTKLYYLFIH